ncbi:MAG: AfsR/SARP family transcriptional regulator [Acidimicrobiales bacterium]
MVAAGVGAVAAGGIIWRLDRARREQAHARPRGRLFARNRPAVEGAERRARAVAAPEVVRWVDFGVRYLSGLVEQLCFDGAATVPSLVLVRVGTCGFEVVLSPAPGGRFGWFSPTRDGTTFVLDPDVDLDDLKALADQRWPAWPALAAIGEADGSTVLLNLEYAGSLSVEGPPERVGGTLACLALQLATQPWCDEMLAGLFAVGGGTLDKQFDHMGAGLRTVAPGDALGLAEKLDRVADAHRELAGEEPLSALRAIACEALPNVAVAFEGAPSEALRCLAEASIPESSGVALAAAGPFPGARWQLELGLDAPARLRGHVGGKELCYELTVRCDREEVALLSEALGASSSREAKAAGPSSGLAVPAAGEVIVITDSCGRPTTPARADGAAGREGPRRGEVEICVLGPVDVVGGDLGAIESSRRMAALGVLSYLACHPRPVSAAELASHLWPLDAGRDDLGGPQRKTVMNVVSRARAVLGYGLGGKERVVYSPMGYRLSDDVSCDWARFELEVANARHRGRDQALGGLRRALELVRGEPFGGALSSQFFEWVASEHLDMTLAAKVVDVAQDLGEMALEGGDFDTVVWAVDKGLQLEPTREEIYCLWMHALGRTGRPAKVDDVYRRLKLVLRQRIHPLQEPQAQSYEVWRSYMSADVANTRS